MVVHRRPAPPLGHEHLVEVGIVDHADLNAAGGPQPDRNSECREPVGVVRRAVQWIDDPAPPGPPLGSAALLGEDGVVGKRHRQAPDDQLLGANVHLGHEVCGAALVGDAARSGELAFQELPGGPRGVDRHASFERCHAAAQCIIRVVHIVVMGSGGVGGYFGAKLQRAGERVTMGARGPHLEALKRSGLAIRSAVEGDRVVRPAAVERLEGVDRADAVLFCVKSFDTDDAAARLWSILGPETPVLSLQNGVDNEDKIDAKLGAGRAMGGVAQVFATIESPGVIRHQAAGRIIFGEMDGKVSERAERLRDAFARAEVPVELSKGIRRALWEKYLLICAVGGTTAVTRETLGVVRDTPATWRLFRAIVEEVAAVGRGAGVDLADDAVEQIVKFAETIPPGNRASLAQDLLQGRRLELEALHGHATRLGERLGVPTPAIFAVYAALSPHAAGRRG